MVDEAAPKLTNEFLITKGEFNSPDEFSVHIEGLAYHKHITHLEALLDYCERKDIEPASIAKSITSSLKQKLQAEAEDLNLLKVKAAKLPV